MNNKSFQTLEMVGETVIVFAAAMWIMHITWIPYIYCIGAILTAVGRFGTNTDSDNDMTLKRLFHIRKIAILFLLLSAVFMFVNHPQYLAYNVYLFTSSWLIFFAIFVVMEVYTTVRILHLTKEK